MPFNNAALDVMGDALTAVTLYASLHSANPSTTGTNETSAARKLVTWTSVNGLLTATGTYAFTGGAASGACTYVGFWSASTSGTFYGGFALTGDQTFNAAGQYTLSGFTATITAS